MTDAKEATGKQRQVVPDTSVLLNFLRVERLHLLVGLPGQVLLVTDHVRGEVIETAHAAVLGEAIAGGLPLEVRVDAADEVEAFGRRALRVGANFYFNAQKSPMRSDHA